MKAARAILLIPSVDNLGRPFIVDRTVQATTQDNISDFSYDSQIEMGMQCLASNVSSTLSLLTEATDLSDMGFIGTKTGNGWGAANRCGTRSVCTIP